MLSVEASTSQLFLLMEDWSIDFVEALSPYSSPKTVKDCLLSKEQFSSAYLDLVAVLSLIYKHVGCFP